MPVFTHCYIIFSPMHHLYNEEERGQRRQRESQTGVSSPCFHPPGCEPSLFGKKAMRMGFPDCTPPCVCFQDSCCVSLRPGTSSTRGGTGMGVPARHAAVRAIVARLPRRGTYGTRVCRPVSCPDPACQVLGRSKPLPMPPTSGSDMQARVAFRRVWG